MVTFCHLFFLAALIVIVIFQKENVSTAHAATSCQGFSYHWDGAYVSENNEGAGANITTQVPALCTTGDSYSDSSIWAMVAGGGSNDGYAQSGYDREYGWSTVRFFAEYSKCNYGCTYYDWYGGNASGTHSYQELYNYVNAIYMYVDSTIVLTTNFDPITVWSSPWQGNWYGETHDAGDDIAGTSSALVYFSGLCLRTARNQGCTTSPSGVTFYSGLSRYHEAWNTVNSKFHVWSTNT